MLVLTRKLQQQIKIGDSITVTVLRVKGSTVRIGVQAPRDVRVVRGELPKGDGSTDDATSPAPVDSQTMPSLEPVLEAVGEIPTGDVQPASAQLPKPAHLPLRKIKNRRGSGPLKQMVAACATLAK